MINLQKKACLLEANDLSNSQIYSIFDKANYYSSKKYSTLNNTTQPQSTVCLAFFENSTRTRLSFEIATKSLGLNVINFTAGNSSLSKGESLADTIRTMDAMHVQLYIIRSQYSGVPQFVSKITNSAIINAGDGRHEHPTQALLDAYTIFQHYGKLEGLKVSIVGDILHSRVARSNINILKTLGAEVKLLGPGTLQQRYGMSLGQAELANISEVVDWSDVVIMLRLQNERMDKGFLPSVSEYVRFYQMTFENFTRKDKIILLHPGPVNYGVELDYRTSKLHNYLVNKQIENGVFIRMAVISQIMEL